jgi:hypothetical protein
VSEPVDETKNDAIEGLKVGMTTIKDEQVGQKQPAKPAPTPDQQLDVFLSQIANHNIRGMIAVTAGFPPEMALPAIVRSYAMVISHLTSMGDFGAIVRMRGTCKKAFEEGIGKFPIQTPPAPPTEGEAKLKAALMNGGAKIG